MKVAVKNIKEKEAHVVLWERLHRKWLSKSSDKKNRRGMVLLGEPGSGLVRQG